MSLYCFKIKYIFYKKIEILIYKYKYTYTYQRHLKNIKLISKMGSTQTKQQQSNFEQYRRDLAKEDRGNYRDKTHGIERTQIVDNRSDEEKLEQLARKRYHQRLKQYDPHFNGYYHEYVEECKALYELECIPACLRYGRGHEFHRI